MLQPMIATVPRFIVTLDTPVSSNPAPVRVPLAITGKWVRGTTEFAITREDLDEIYRNFQERLNGEINVDYDHASEMPEVAVGGPIPSAGRIVRLDPPEPAGARHILWGWYEPTERARELIANREYRYISPAIDWTARSKRTGRPQGTTITSVALTNRPFLEEMPQIRLSDPSYRAVEETEPLCELKKQSPKNGGTMKIVKFSVVEDKIKLSHDDWQDEYYALPEDLKRVLEEFGLLSETPLASELQTLAGRPGAALSECVAEIGRRLSAQQKITLGQAAALLSEAEARGKLVAAEEIFRAHVEHVLDENVRAGKVLPRQREPWRKIALADFPSFQKLMAEQNPQVPLRPLGFSGTAPENVQAQVKFLAEQRMHEQNMTFGQALTEIGREQPDLMQQYRRAVSGTE